MGAMTQSDFFSGRKSRVRGCDFSLIRASSIIVVAFIVLMF